MSADPEWISKFRSQTAWIDKLAERSKSFADLVKLPEMPSFGFSPEQIEQFGQVQAMSHALSERMNHNLAALSELKQQIVNAGSEAFREMEEHQAKIAAALAPL